jgi:hypothetical protein
VSFIYLFLSYLTARVYQHRGSPRSILLAAATFVNYLRSVELRYDFSGCLYRLLRYFGLLLAHWSSVIVVVVLGHKIIWRPCFFTKSLAKWQRWFFASFWRRPNARFQIYILYDMIWYDMICDIFVSYSWVDTSGSSTVHIYTQALHKVIQARCGSEGG